MFFPVDEVDAFGQAVGCGGLAAHLDAVQAIDVEGLAAFPGISDVEAGKGGQTFDVYSLNGIKVRSQAATTDGLPKGIYLINGKKHIVK